jgi:putative ABC transport system permease protein
MFKSLMLIGRRNLVKDRLFSILNLLGLSTGLTCTLLIYLWVSDEMKIDRFHRKGERLYQVMENAPLADGGLMTTEHTPDPLAGALTTEFPEMESTATVKFPDEDENPRGILSTGETSIKAAEIYATPNFFDFFSFRLLDGYHDQVLADPSSVLISDELARKLFHTTKELRGKTLTWNRGPGDAGSANGTYVVSGIFEAVPGNSSMLFDLIFSHQLYVEKNKDYINWKNSNPSTYVLLREGVTPEKINEKLKLFAQRKFGSGSKNHQEESFFLQGYADRYLHNRYENGSPVGGRIEYVRLFSWIAAIILVIACINFMNLSTAKSSRRIKEVGIRKVMGARRGMLIIQYLAESLLMTTLALLISGLLIALLLPAFRSITGKSLFVHADAGLVLTVAGVTLLTGILSGSYPAIYLSGFRPAMILKGKLRTASGESWVRKGLVVVQFSISVVLILAVLVVYEQMKLIRTINLGYDKSNIIHFSSEGRIQQNQGDFLSALKKIPGVVSASGMEGDMLGNHSGGGGIDWPGKSGRVEFSGLYVDFDFMETMNLRMKEGRMFSAKYSSDSTGVIFNESAITAMKLENPVGKSVRLWGLTGHIIGVVKDFHFESLYNHVGPLFIAYRQSTDNIVVKVIPEHLSATLGRMAELYKQYNPGLPFEYQFLDEDYRKLYISEERVSVLSRYFAGMAIIISCLGLFGMAAFTAHKRQKEIGIRKVIGASMGNVAVLLSRDFFKLIFRALLIALPLAWWLMNHWLEGFAYRVRINPGLFVLTAATTLFITALTISYQSLKAGMTDPVKSLRAE